MSLLLALLALILLWSNAGSGSSEAGSAVIDDGVVRTGPTLIDGAYQVPPSGLVIRAVVNNGPLSPEYQTGYEVTIAASGRATVIVTPVGAAEELGEARTAEISTTTVELGAAGLQRLLAALDQTGFFFLPQPPEYTDLRIGGDVSNLAVTLADGVWVVESAGLTPDARAHLDAAQELIAAAVGLPATV